MLSRKTKYAINALVYLAKRHGQGPVLIGDIAESENIPQKFLEAILLDLKKVGILASRKGRGGGYYLLRGPSDVNIADIMRLFDGPIAMLPCVSYKFYERCEECKDETHCGIRSVFFELRNQMVSQLKAATLEDIIRREQILVESSEE